MQEVVDRLVALHESAGIHNVNLVTPDHFLPHTVAIVKRLRERGVWIPTVYNFSGYQRVESLRMIESVADIYLPDFKYGMAALARGLSQAEDYATVALEALSEMVRQKGFLDTFITDSHDKPDTLDPGYLSGTALEGVLVRHLILPGQIENSLQVMNMLFLEFGQGLPISLMSQYVPVHQFPSDSPLNRGVTGEEFQMVLQHAQDLGFRNLFVQYPEQGDPNLKPFLPDFLAVNPFSGNMGSQA
jgi:putative pyruvate formate lyase activating enzyme